MTELKDKILAVMKTWKESEWDHLEDGHGLFKAIIYTKPLSENGFGLPEEFVLPLVKDHKSDGSWKGSITMPDGTILATVKGIYNLDLVEALKKLFNLETEFYFGRGRVARAIVEKLKELV